MLDYNTKVRNLSASYENLIVEPEYFNYNYI